MDTFVQQATAEKAVALLKSYPPDCPEIWADIAEYNGVYKISTTGKLRSIERAVHKKMYGNVLASYVRRGRLMRFDTVNGYYQVCLCKNSIKVRHKVARLVAAAFLDNPHNKPFVNHIDNNPLNNHVSNLEWCTPKENVAHALRQGRMKSAENLPPVRRGVDKKSAKLNDSQVREIRASTLSQRQLGAIYKVSKTAIRYVKIGRTWSHVNA